MEPRTRGDAMKRSIVAAALATALLLNFGQIAGAVPAAAPRALPSSHMVTLITGDRVIVSNSAGVTTYRIIRAFQSGAGAQMTTANVNGDEYVIPLSVQPYLSRYLAVNLFDVTKLVAAGVSDQLPLVINYTGATPMLPGVTITAAGNGVATGYVTADSARQFGAALAAQNVTDAAAGYPAVSSLFGTVTGISAGVTVAAAAKAVIPFFPMRTLIIDGITPKGTPLPFAFGFLMNSDDARKFGAFVFMFHGEARVSVPLGHYTGVFDTDSFSTGGSIDVRVMPFADYNVASAGQTMTIDAGAAVATPSVTTPLPSATQDLTVTINESDALTFGSFSGGYEVGTGVRLLLTPTPPAAFGTLGETTQWSRVDPSVAGGRYSFDIKIFDSGVPADQSHIVPDVSRLASINATYNSDQLLRLGGTMRFLLSPGETFVSGSFLPLPMPASRTEYVYAPAGTVRQDIVMTDFNAYWDPGIVQDDWQPVDPGSVMSETWLRNPFTLGIPEVTADDPFPVCDGCRTFKAMTFASAPTDGFATHSAWVFAVPGFPPVARFSVFLNGTLLLRENNSLGDVFPVPGKAGTYRMVTLLDRYLTSPVLSTSIRSDITFQSGGGQGAPMPAGWYCLTGPTCTVMPVLQALIDLHASPQGTLPLGKTTFDLSVGHIQGADDPPLTAVTVQVRRSGAATWTKLKIVMVSPGQYRVSFNAKAPLNGMAMDLQITAKDNQGGILRQTVQRAFMVSA